MVAMSILVIAAYCSYVVQHLVFHSPVPVVSTPAIVAAPAMLPTTGGADGESSGALVLGIALLGLGFGLRRRQARATL
jgi:MYXO-CTERM domain-containing protein